MARIDKFIWAVRLFKTRSLAANQCKTNKILVNDEAVKSSKTVKVGDIVTVRKSGAAFKYKVIELLEKRVGAKLVENYIVDITAPEELEKYKLYMLSQSSYRDNGMGKPTTKERRRLEQFLKRGYDD
ncbi:RNA-binding S4 domain-containing protein [Crocinitomix catalasitica]|uniref:RNA-binding S4 domain-containing protein n=1 Tax=Crocinitomix catalasitica TaxID=184607 RepID=UPI000562F8F2|nr:RNA-binding S4 domain-containing protein [Crocinitomix catalasitica]